MCKEIPSLHGGKGVSQLVSEYTRVPCPSLYQSVFPTRFHLHQHLNPMYYLHTATRTWVREVYFRR